MKKILTVIGARPQIIKSAAISRAIRGPFSSALREILVHTGQHYDENMSGVFFHEMDIPQPDLNLNVGSGSHGSQTAAMIDGLEKAMVDQKPDVVLLYGDTNSTLAGSLAAAKLHIPIAHVEAGLRSFEKYMPEEINRICCDHASTLLFSPTLQGIANLKREGFDPSRETPWSPDHPGVFHCGDVMLDNTLHFAEKAKTHSRILQELGLSSKPFILATMHRDRNTDEPERLESICKALVHIAKEMPIVFPVHPRTQGALEKLSEQEAIGEFLAHPEIHRIPAVSFLDMIQLESSCELVITDSGGVQKEAFFLKKPSLILRPHTEWTELVESGQALLVDADTMRIVQGFQYMHSTPPSSWPAIFGNGKAAEFICERILEHLG